MISDIIVFLFVLLFVWLGYKAGFIKTLFGMCSYFISIILGFMLYPIVSGGLKNSFIYDSVLKFSEKQININFKGNTLFNDILMKVGAEAANATAELLINIISFVLVIIVCKILISLISKSLSFISKVPVISFLNRILGGVLGGLKGILLLYILFLVINFLPTNITEKTINDINESKIASKFYKENLIIDILGRDIVKADGKWE